MPRTYPARFIRHCLRDGILQAGTGRAYTLQHLATWLQMESEVEKICSQIAELYRADTSLAPRTANQTQREANNCVVQCSSETS